MGMIRVGENKLVEEYNRWVDLKLFTVKVNSSHPTITLEVLAHCSTWAEERAKQYLDESIFRGKYFQVKASDKGKKRTVYSARLNDERNNYTRVKEKVSKWMYADVVIPLVCKCEVPVW